MKKEFAKYDILFAEVMKNFEKKKSEFEQLRKMSRTELIAYNEEVKIENIPTDWRTSLEMHLPEGKDDKHDHESHLHEYQATKKDEFDQIEQFMHVLHDWVEEKKHEMEVT